MPTFKKLSIVIPVYNEEKTIDNLIQMVEKAPIGELEKELIIVNDASTDSTPKKLKKFTKKHKVVNHKKNQGKSAAVKTGLLETTGDIVIIQDADLEYDPNEYKLLLKPILDDRADVVYGSRFTGSQPHRTIYFENFLGNRFLTFFSNLLTGLNLTDMETCYKMFRGDLIREIAPTLESKRFGFEPEVTAKVAKKKARVYEVGISYYGRTKEEGKHINWKDGAKAIWEIIKFNVFR